MLVECLEAGINTWAVLSQYFSYKMFLTLDDFCDYGD